MTSQPPPPRVSINPVSSDLVQAVRRTGTARDPRLRRSDGNTEKSTTVSSVATTFTVTISQSGVDKKKHRERSSNSNEELFGDSTYQKKSSKSVTRTVDDKKDKRDDRDKKSRDPRTSRKSPKPSSEEKRYKDEPCSPRHQTSPKHQTSRTPEKSVSKSRSEESRSKSNESVDEYIRKREKSSDKHLLKPHQLPPIPKLKNKLTLVSSKSIERTKLPSKTKDSTDDQNSVEKRKPSKSKKPSELLSLEETIRLKKKQIDDELKANAKNLHELHEKINEKEKSNEKEKMSDNGRAIEKSEYDEEDVRQNSFDSSTEEVNVNVDDIIRIRLRKPDSQFTDEDYNETDIDDVDYNEVTDVDYKETDIDDIIRMRNQFKSKPTESERTSMESIVEACQQEEDKKRVSSSLSLLGSNNEEPPRPRLFIKNIALLTKPPTPPSQDLEEISDDELVAESTMPITGLLEDDSEEAMSDEEQNTSSLDGVGKFKELKASSLKRLRQFVRSRDQMTPSPPPPPRVKESTQSKHLRKPSLGTLFIFTLQQLQPWISVV